MSDDTHKPDNRPKTRFEPVSRPPRSVSGGPPTQPPLPSPPPLPTLRLLEPGAAPRAAGLFRDERGFVVGPQGLVAVQGARRLSTFLPVLSQIADLARGTALEVHDDDLYIVVLTPGVEPGALAQFYATVQGALVAARLGSRRAGLYVGDGRLFVPFADPNAPHGYDATGAPPSQGRALLRPNAPSLLLEPHPDRLLDALLRVPLQSVSLPLSTTNLSLLTDRRMAALVAGYVQRHGMAYGVRFFSWTQGERTTEVALFDIVTADAVRPVPGFVCDFLRRMPHTILLSDALEPADLEREPMQRILLPLGRRTPLHLPHVQALLPSHCLLILAEAPWGSAMITAPPPRTSMQRLTELTLSAPVTLQLSAQPPGRLRLHLALRHDGPVRGPIHGLLLDAMALARLRRMVRHLPAPFFAHARIALGDGVALILAADAAELIGLPLGQPLARAEPPTLLLPRGMRLLPNLPQDLIAPLLGLQSDMLTVLTPTSRYDLEPDALQPLSSLLSLDPPVRTSVIAVRPSNLPPLNLSDLEELPKPQPSMPTPVEPIKPSPKQEQRGLFDRLFDRSPSDKLTDGDFQIELRRRADELEQRGELELAAAFYSYLRDEKRAAACYQRLVGDNRMPRA